MTLARHVRIWRQRVRSLARGRALDSELEGELAFHLEQLIAEKRAEGFSPEDARRAARLEFGNVAAVAEASRDTRHLTWVHDVGRDVVFGLRLLRKSPVFTVVTTASLALGIGANAAVLATIDSVLVRGLPVPQADRLISIRNVSTDRPGQTAGVSVNELMAWRDGSRTLDVIAAALSMQQDFGGDRYGAAEHLRGQSVTPELFTLFGATPLAGRTFEPGEGRLLSTAQPIIISERLWRRRYGADPQIIGATIRVGGTVRSVVGILPESFRFQDVLVDFWLPLRILPEPNGSLVRLLRVVARMKPGVTRAQAQADLDAIAPSLALQFPDRQRGWHAEVQGLDEALYGWAREPLLTLQIAVALVFVIACANVAGLLLARGASRRREINLRLALGAGRDRIVRQFLTESLVLAAAGGALGLAVAWLGLHGLSAMTPALASPSLGPMSLDARVLAIACALSALSAVGFGLVPALTASQADPVEVVRVSGAERTTPELTRSHAVVVAAQFAVALMLMIDAALLVKSSARLAGRDLHFEPDGVLMFDLSLPVPQRALGTYRDAPYFEIVTSPAPVFGRVLERLRGLSEVQAAGGSSYPAVNSLIIPTVDVLLDGASASPRVGRSIDDVAYFVVTPGFFETIRAPVVTGRDVNDRDTASSPWVLVVNETAARSFWPGENPIGKHVRLDTVPEEQPREVVGVVPDIPLRHGEVAPRPIVYASYLQQPARWRAPWRTLFGNMTFVVRTSGDPNALVGPVRRAIADIDPDRPVAGAGSVRQHLDAAMKQFRYFVFLVTLLACTAGALAVMGIYGTVSYAAGQRTHDIGIRKALGASRWQIAMLVGRAAVELIAVGVVAGVAGAFVLARIIASQLWGIAPTDLATYIAVPLLLIAVAACACFLPVRRAIAADPAAAIRFE